MLADPPSQCQPLAARSRRRTLPLSRQLRAATQLHHARLEARAALPEGPGALQAYVALLLMFRALHGFVDAAWAALEQAAARPSRSRHGFAPRGGRICAAIDHDLLALGQPRAAEAAARCAFAPLTRGDLAPVLGARYVAEGSTLGNTILLRHVEQRLGTQVAQASRFLGQNREAAASSFRQFRAALDSFGAAEPEACIAVIDGATATFAACATLLDDVRPAVTVDAAGLRT